MKIQSARASQSFVSKLTETSKMITNPRTCALDSFLHSLQTCALQQAVPQQVAAFWWHELPKFEKMLAFSRELVEFFDKIKT